VQASLIYTVRSDLGEGKMETSPGASMVMSHELYL